jgi:7,8-dihydropterin-6-yl-methyl-4-(beta-D-ribofuranosyl)aminobenzene 5'-phosphate synthase
MKLTVLVDNHTLIDRYFLGEAGVSYFIEDGEYRVLFDVGYSDVFIANARKINIDLLQMDHLVLSHGHLDHTWGLEPLIKLYTEAAVEGAPRRRPRLTAHPLVFAPKLLEGVGDIGMNIPETMLARHFELQLSRQPQWLTDRLVFLGEIERQNDFEAQHPLGRVVIDGREQDDFLLDDSALAYRSAKGLVVITGCSHAGICNIVEQAREICREERVVDIIGGFSPAGCPGKPTARHPGLPGRAVSHKCSCLPLYRPEGKGGPGRGSESP